MKGSRQKGKDDRMRTKPVRGIPYFFDHEGHEDNEGKSNVYLDVRASVLDATIKIRNLQHPIDLSASIQDDIITPIRRTWY